MRKQRAIGLMSGTSMDGVDAALIETDGDGQLTCGGHLEQAYTPEERALLRAALADAVGMDDRTARPGALRAAEALVTRAHAAAVSALLAREGLAATAVDVVGFHGQTVLHRPERRFTVQIGDAAVLASTLGIPVVADFRAADVAAGGQGAPLVPVFHRALALASSLPRPLAILNLGGIGNITSIDAEGDLVAFDTGPGNALLDDLMMSRCGLPCDADGRAAACGRVDPNVLRDLLADPYFTRPLPKSLDRGDLTSHAAAALTLEDAAATLTAFTAESVGLGLAMLPYLPQTLIVAGGGARNPSMVAALRASLPCPVRTADDIGWSSGALEAQAFGYLAVRRLVGLPATFSGTTGVPQPVVAGVLNYP